jgi:very-short-patch-repair endonuclease
MEKKFWEAVRNRRFLGLKFIRQYPIRYQFDGKDRFFVADFYCDALKLVIELDGLIHQDQKSHDQAREEMISATGILVIRFTNRDINHDLAHVLSELKRHVNNDYT